jgi:hypothetical protein
MRVPAGGSVARRQPAWGARGSRAEGVLIAIRSTAPRGLSV